MVVATCVLWLPVFLFCCLLALSFNGLPVFYISLRRHYKESSVRLIKFRTMTRNAEKVANRNTIPVDGQRFLNIPIESPLYTPLGRYFERLFLTELPQVFLVIAAKMTIIGNRPLPKNIVDLLAADFPHVNDRFLIPGGLTGPVQLVGRESLSDEMRLALEIQYCLVCRDAYTLKLDFMILLYTVMIALRLRPHLTPSEVEARVLDWSSADRLQLQIPKLAQLASRQP